MNTQLSFGIVSGIQAVPTGHAATFNLALLVISALALATPAMAQSVETAAGNRYVDRANCFAGASNNDAVICLKEANAALAALPQVKPIDVVTHYQKSVSLRRQAPPAADREASGKQMRGDGAVSDRVKGTRVLRELPLQT